MATGAIHTWVALLLQQPHPDHHLKIKIPAILTPAVLTLGVKIITVLQNVLAPQVIKGIPTTAATKDITIPVIQIPVDLTAFALTEIITLAAPVHKDLLERHLIAEPSVRWINTVLTTKFATNTGVKILAMGHATIFPIHNVG